MEASDVTDSHGRILAEEEKQEDLASVVSSFLTDDEDESTNSMDSMEEEEEELREDATSSSSSLNSHAPSSSSSSNDLQVEDRHVFEMSSLISILPFKRGLSKHYDGKSQSFTSLANVGSLEDLAKPESAWKRKKKKRLKPCQSYAGGLDIIHSSLSPKASSRVISKKPSRVATLFSPKLSARRTHSFYSASRILPIPPVRSNSSVISSDHQALLFA